jgi:hypothetical protein
MDELFVQAYRLDRNNFYALVDSYGEHWERKCRAPGRETLSAAKCLAITLEWLAHGVPFNVLARTYDVGKTTVVNVVHQVVKVLHRHLVPHTIHFPTSQELPGVIDRFSHLCRLPGCCGALDGTFMRIERPRVSGEAYYCYKKHFAIIILACVDADGYFTFIDAGNPGSLGDAWVWNGSALKRKIEQRDLLVWPEGVPQMRTAAGYVYGPYIVADSAFALSEFIMKCYETDNPTAQQFRFNFATIRTRRVVENAFGHLKGRWRILNNSRLSVPRWAGTVATVCCALHNVAKKAGIPMNPNDVVQFQPSQIAHAVGQRRRGGTAMAAAEEMRDALAAEMDARLSYVNPAVYLTAQVQQVVRWGGLPNGQVPDGV